MSEQLDIIETATAQGVATVMVPGYARTRAAQRQRPLEASEQPRLDEWQRLARDFPTQVSDGEGPVH